MVKRRHFVPVATCFVGVAIWACGGEDGAAPSSSSSASSSSSGASGDASSSSSSSTSSSSGGDASTSAWETVEPLAAEGDWVAEKVSYRSGALKIFGRVCRPKAAGKFKTLVLNHGGFEGHGPFNKDGCANLVKNGYVMLESSYRGEDGSEGKIEVCLGEVDDVLAMVDLSKRLPYVDGAKTVMAGLSHGGCITTRAVQRGAKVAAAADVFGPKDFVTEYAFLKASQQAGQGGLEPLIRILETATGGTPETKPDEYAKRSPLSFVADLDKFPGPYTMVHGVKDILVPVRDTCRFAAVVKDTKSYHLNAALAVVTNDPQGCEGTNVAWLPGPKPGAWPAPRYAVVYDDAGHEVTSQSGAAMYLDALGFLVAKNANNP